MSPILFLIGCGYSVVSPVMPPGVRRVAVASFSVGQGEPDLGSWVAAAVATELVSAPGVSLAREGSDDAEALIRGEVRLVGDEAVALEAGAPGPRAVLAAPALEGWATLTAPDGRVLRSAGPLRIAVLRSVGGTGEDDRRREHRALRAGAAGLGRAIARALLSER